MKKRTKKLLRPALLRHPARVAEQRKRKSFLLLFFRKEALAFLERLRRRARPEVRIARGYRNWIAGEAIAGDRNGPLISVLVPVYDTPAETLLATINSVLRQTYAHWELCIADDASSASHVATLLAEQAARDGRLRIVQMTENRGIAASTNAALAQATGRFVALLDHDDVLAPHALARIAAELAGHPDADIVFSDEDQLVDGVRCRPYFKPGWNPDLMLCQNLVSHLGVYRRSLVDRIGGMRETFDGSQDYDLALRAWAATRDDRIRHVPEMLYHWRQHARSFSAQREAQCQAAARAALRERLGETACVEPNTAIPQWTRIVYRLPDPAPLVSVVVPMGAVPPADPAYGRVEILHGDAADAAGDVVVFLAPGLSAGGAGWLRELVSQAGRPEIGCAGGRLDRPDGRIGNAGLWLHPRCISQTLAPRSDHGDPGYLGHFLLARTVSAVSLDCLAIRRDILIAVGGLDRRAGRYGDVDLCLRLAQRGLRCVWTPHARLRYRAVPRPRADAAAVHFMQARWGKTLSEDPYANPSLVIRHKNLALRQRPFRP